MGQRSAGVSWFSLWRLLLVRVAALLALCVWLGGFMFYSAVVIHVLHDQLTSLDAGFITREVTVWLNGLGMASLALLAALAWLERGEGPRWTTRLRVGLLVSSGLILVMLFILHGTMARRLDEGQLRGFYPWHRVYLIASTAQWAANVGIMAATVVVWTSTATGQEMAWAASGDG